MLIRAFKPIVLLCILAITTICYLPGLTGHFIFDDGANIRLNTDIRIDRLDFPSLGQAASSGSAGLFKRPISMVSFAVNYYVSGMDAYYFKLCNLGIHLINGLLVFVLSRLLLRLYVRVHRVAMDDKAGFWIAAAVTAIWLLHPFNLTGVLYVVQRMTSLAALFTLVGLVLYLYGRQYLLDGNRVGMWAIGIAVFVMTPLAALCKENGALLPVLILAAEAILLRWTTAKTEHRRALFMVVGLSAILPIILGLAYLLKHPDVIFTGYSWRNFTLAERMMTEARVMWFYLQMIVLPSMTEMGLHHDDIPISRGLFLPWTTLPAIGGVLLLVTGGFALRNKQPMIAFGIAFFFVGHALESTIFPLELAFEHRNYLPMFGILLPLAYYVLNPKLHLPSVRARRAVFLMLLVLFTGLTASRAQQWGNALLMRTMEVERHPRSVRAHTDLASLYDHLPPTSQMDAINLYDKARFHYRQAADVEPSSISGLIGLLAVNAERKLAIDEILLETLEQRLATVPFGPPNKNTLIGLARCIASGECTVGAEKIERIYRAALSNPSLTGGHRDQVISEFGQVPVEIWPRVKMRN